MLEMPRSTTASSHQTSIRSSRKSEWLRSALAHRYDPDPGVENEIVVLATGIDQYLQEVFHHLAYYNGDDLISGEDFRLLCSVLGIPISAEGEEEQVDGEEARDICSGLPRELHFKEFHRRLCGYFNTRARNRTADARLPVTEETEHIEREIRLRWPRVRRRKCVSFDLSKNVHSDKRAMCRPGSLVKPDSLNSFAQLDGETAGSGPQWVALQHLEAENASLRELVEDLRSALQGSNARCLALEVALRRQDGSPLTKSTGERRGDARLAHQPRREWTARGVTNLLRELNLIRASRDGQLEEAMKFNQRLEAELEAAYREGQQLEEALIRLQRENRQIKQKAEEARAALARGLGLVREIQGQASTVPSLQGRIRELEEQLQSLRNGCTCRTEPEPEPENLSNPPSMMVGPPLQLCSTGSDESYIREEGLQRAVEGRAASDEEEEDRENKKDGQCCLVEMKKLINRLPNCGKGCQKMAARHLLISQGCLDDVEPGGSGLSELTGQSRRRHGRLEERGSELEKMLSLLGKDLQLKQEEVEMLRMEVQMVETERVRLSLLEEKLTDTLTLLLQLRTKNISRRAFGKIIMDTLDVCCKNGHGPSNGLQVLEALSMELLSCELLGEEGGARAGTGTYRNSANPLLISC
ncbi:EF-hand and coiled-coil domain-containing protein 1 [Anguilla anguilla]|uniref:EF-hand and coiled-coil domain-containing protein 1 n=1 Tax=Anguilla anguilla TaxID=7936 RepID=UPI0015A99188|nr:EF-hand and coiled-coil domain-containing protein 1 [Anguilla anguilla]